MIWNGKVMRIEDVKLHTDTFMLCTCIIKRRIEDKWYVVVSLRRLVKNKSGMWQMSSRSHTSGQWLVHGFSTSDEVAFKWLTGVTW